MALHDPFERPRALEVEAMDELAFVGAGVGPGSGGDRAGEDRQLPQRNQRPHRPDAEPVRRAPPLPGFVARAPGEREGGVQQHHREDEVGHHQARGEVVLDHEGAEDRLPDHPEGQQGAEEGEVPAVGPAEQGEDAGGDHREADEAGQQPVAVLDHRVRFERRGAAAVAFRPVRAAEAGAGQAHGGAGEHDQGESRQGDERHLRVALRGDLEAAFEAIPHLPAMIAAATRPQGTQPLDLPPAGEFSIRYWTRSSSSSGLRRSPKFCGITLAS